MKNQEYVNHQDKLYMVYRKINQAKINTDYLNEIKKLWHCDIVLRQKNSPSGEFLLFLREIPEVEYVD